MLFGATRLSRPSLGDTVGYEFQRHGHGHAGTTVSRFWGCLSNLQTIVTQGIEDTSIVSLSFDPRSPRYKDD